MAMRPRFSSESSDLQQMAKRRCCRALESGVVVDWTKLLPEILNLILDKLLNHLDYIRFGAVCKSWRGVAIHQKHRRTSPVYFLIRPSNEAELDEYLQTGYFKLSRGYLLLNAGEGKYYEFNHRKLLPDDTDDDAQFEFYGSSYGWMALRRRGDDSITLCSPFNRTKSVKLPKIPEEFGKFFKIFMSCDPCTCPEEGDNNLVLAAIGMRRRVALIRAGDKSWTLADTVMEGDERPFPFVDLIFHRGFLYAVDCFHRLVAIDYNRGWRTQSGLFPTVVILSKKRPLLQLSDLPRTLLAESASGELFMILQAREDCGQFMVGSEPYYYKKLEKKHKGITSSASPSGQKEVEEEEEEMEWVKVRKLDTNKDGRFLVFETICLCFQDPNPDWSDCPPKNLDAKPSEDSGAGREPIGPIGIALLAAPPLY
ncbi:OLC1v1024863C2 [Oldenlandia corymbosa var. corymbosa]|nr:OLC1v1024863C2 [Oldenlandia corymbosa var. corymbosa]